MASFEDLQRMLNKFPVWKCPECGERNRGQFMLFMMVPFEVSIAEFDHLEKTIYGEWRDGQNDKDDFRDVEIWCANCEKTYPLPEGWKLVMR